jgi:hypothetical protein
LPAWQLCEDHARCVTSCRRDSVPLSTGAAQPGHRSGRSERLPRDASDAYAEMANVAVASATSCPSDLVTSP